MARGFLATYVGRPKMVAPTAAAAGDASVEVAIGGVAREIQRELGKAMALLAWAKGAQRCMPVLRVDTATL
jgi:hypothetical protein